MSSPSFIREPSFVRGSSLLPDPSMVEEQDRVLQATAVVAEGHFASNALLVSEGVMEAAGIGLVVYALTLGGGMTFFIPGAFLAMFAAALYCSQLHNAPKMKKKRDEENESVIDTSRIGQAQIIDLDAGKANSYGNATPNLYQDELGDWGQDEEREMRLTHNGKEPVWTADIAAQVDEEIGSTVSFEVSEPDTQASMKLGCALTDAEEREEDESDQDNFLDSWKCEENGLNSPISKGSHEQGSNVFESFASSDQIPKWEELPDGLR